MDSRFYRPDVGFLAPFAQHLHLLPALDELVLVTRASVGNDRKPAAYSSAVTPGGRASLARLEIRDPAAGADDRRNW